MNEFCINLRVIIKSIRVKYIAVLVFLSLFAIPAFAQTPSTEPKTKKEKKEARRQRINELIAQEEEGEIIFNKQNSFHFKLTTDGYGFGYEFGKFKSNRLATLFQFELSERKHPKEKKQGASINNQFQINSVIPGKMNNFYQVKFGIGQQRIIGGKSNKNGVAVAAVYSGGLSLGLAKPYFVDVKDGMRVQYDVVIDSGYVPLGASGFTYGWNKVKLHPGLFLKTALRFDYGRLNETVTAVEVGLMAEFYAKKVEQMLYNDQKQFFFNAYLAILLGRRK